MPATVNVISSIMHSAVLGAPPVKVGDGLSICYWTDRHAGTVVEVIDQDHVVYTVDEVKPDTNASHCQMGHQSWIMTPQPNGPKCHAMRHKDGRWYVATLGKHGRYTVSKKSTPVSLGH